MLKLTLIWLKEKLRLYTCKPNPYYPPQDILKGKSNNMSKGPETRYEE